MMALGYGSCLALEIGRYKHIQVDDKRQHVLFYIFLFGMNWKSLSQNPENFWCTNDTQTIQ